MTPTAKTIKVLILCLFHCNHTNAAVTVTAVTAATVATVIVVVVLLLLTVCSALLCLHSCMFTFWPKYASSVFVIVTGEVSVKLGDELSLFGTVDYNPLSERLVFTFGAEYPTPNDAETWKNQLVKTLEGNKIIFFS